MRIIAGRWRSRLIKAPKGLDVRPTTDKVREAWMSAMGSSLANARVLDLFAGSGALGLEALSRGAASVVFVERAKDSMRSLKENIDTLDAAEVCTVIRADVLTYLKRLGPDEFDLVVADPPYGDGQAALVAERYLSEPFASQLWLEHRTGDEMPQAEDRRQRFYGDTTLSTYFGE